MLVDVSHVVEHGMMTYKGLPAPLICDFLSREQSRSLYAPGTEFHIGKIEMVANTGTYLDSPFHRYADGVDLAGLPLERLAALDAIVIRSDTARGRAIDVNAVASLDVRGKAVLVHTGWSAHWRTDRYFEGHPFLTPQAASWLRDRQRCPHAPSAESSLSRCLPRKDTGESRRHGARPTEDAHRAARSCGGDHECGALRRCLVPSG